MPKHPQKNAPLDASLNPAEFKLGKRIAEVCGAGMLVNLAGKIYGGEARRLLTGQPTDYSTVPADLAADLAELAQCCMQMKVEVHGDFSTLADDERGIVLANHPSDITLWSWANVIAKKFTPKLKAVAKKEVMYEPKTIPPIFGWLGKLSELLILIDRNDRESAVKSIRESCETIFAPGTALCLFPDGHRPSKKNLEESHAKMKEKGYSNPAEFMPHTCFPKSRGLFEILRATQDSRVRILNTTVGLSVDENGPDVLASTIHILGEEVEREAILGSSSDPERQRQHVGGYLIEDYSKKNALITDWRALT